jgi:dephospho-CoA kinase
MILCITGKIGTGKSTCARKIQADGFFDASDGRIPFEHAEICEADTIGHELLDDPPVKELIVDTFGAGVLENDMISRKKLGDIVFVDRSNMKALTAIMHPKITKRCYENIKKAKLSERNVIIAVALPKSLNILSQCDRVIHLDVDKEEVWRRIQERDPNMSRERFDTIWVWQDDEYERELV